MECRFGAVADLFGDRRNRSIARAQALGGELETPRRQVCDWRLAEERRETLGKERARRSDRTRKGDDRQDTIVMDGAAEALPKSALLLAAERILVAMGGDPSDEALVGRVGNSLQWALCASSGAVYGLLDATVPKFHQSLGAPLIVALIAFDEFGLAALELGQTPEHYPTATHVRSV